MQQSERKKERKKDLGLISALQDHWHSFYIGKLSLLHGAFNNFAARKDVILERYDGHTIIPVIFQPQSTVSRNTSMSYNEAPLHRLENTESTPITKIARSDEWCIWFRYRYLQLDPSAVKLKLDGNNYWRELRTKWIATRKRLQMSQRHDLCAKSFGSLVNLLGKFKCTFRRSCLIII